MTLDEMQEHLAEALFNSRFDGAWAGYTYATQSESAKARYRHGAAVLLIEMGIPTHGERGEVLADLIMWRDSLPRGHKQLPGAIPAVEVAQYRD